MPLDRDETVADALTWLNRLQESSPDDLETLQRVLDISRVYVMRHLAQPARLLPAVQPLIDADLALEIAPLLRKAQELVVEWGIGRIGSARLSAEWETVTLLDRFEPESAAAALVV